MWFIKINSFTRGTTWYFINDQGFPQMSDRGEFAQAFGPANVESHRQLLAAIFGNDRVELVECSSRKLLTPAMLKTLNLEQV